MKDPAVLLLERHRVGLVRSRVRVTAWPERCGGGQQGRSLPRSALGSEVRPEVDALDLQSAALLCEAAYRTHFSEQELRGHMASVRVLLSEAAVGDLSVHSAGGQRYVVSHSPGAVYVAFQGTKHIADWATNLRLRHAPLWGGDGDGRDEHLAAHCGFSRRSMALPLLELRDAARAAGKRLILCGHSLGGAVAMLSAVTLLRASAAEAPGGSEAGEDPFAEDPQIRCVTFAAPPVANEALAAEVAAAGWDRYISNFVLPEDPVVPMINRLMRAGEGLDGSSDGGGNGGGNAPGGSEDGCAHAAGQAGTEALQALGGATAVAAAARAVAHLLPLHLLLQAPAAAAAEVSDTTGWCDWDDGDALIDPSALLPHGAATSLASTVAALGPAALAGQAARARSNGGGSAGGGWGPLQLHGRRAHRLIRWAHDPRLAGQLRRHYQHQHAPPRQRPQPPPSWRPRPQGATQAHAAAVAARGVGWEVARLLLTKQVDVAVPQQAVIKSNSNRPNTSSSSIGDEAGRGGSNGGAAAAAIEAARAWMSRALAGGLLSGGALRAAAMSAPRLLPALTRGAAPLIERLLPAAVGLDVLAAAVVAAVVPRTCPIGSQWVLTHQGPQPADRPISDYPQQPHALGLRELGGLFPGHRMVSYRNRVAQLGRARRGAKAAAAAEPHSEEARAVIAGSLTRSRRSSSSSLGGAARRDRRHGNGSSIGGSRPGSRRGSRSSDAGDGDGGSGPQPSLTPQLSPA